MSYNIDAVKGKWLSNAVVVCVILFFVGVATNYQSYVNKISAIELHQIKSSSLLESHHEKLHSHDIILAEISKDLKQINQRLERIEKELSRLELVKEIKKQKHKKQNAGIKKVHQEA